MKTHFGGRYPALETTNCEALKRYRATAPKLPAEDGSFDQEMITGEVNVVRSVHETNFPETTMISLVSKTLLLPTSSLAILLVVLGVQLF